MRLSCADLTNHYDTAKGNRVRVRVSTPLIFDRDMAHATKQSGIDVERFRQRLMQLEQETIRKINRDVELARESDDDRPDPVDQSVVDELRDEHLVLAQTDSEVLAQIRAALERIENGTYGRCVVDGEAIDPARLEAVPWAPYCARHQREAEARAGMRTPRV
jgi:RNA polymerase-binding transcription factor DksA